MFFGLETLGFDGPATTFITPGACHACFKAKASFHRSCSVSKAAAKALAAGLARPRRTDGDWLLELTDTGVKRAAEIDAARRARGSR